MPTTTKPSAGDRDDVHRAAASSGDKPEEPSSGKPEEQSASAGARAKADEQAAARAKDKQDDAPAEQEYERALFRSEQHPDLTQYLPSGAVAHFQGQYFSTGDTALIAELRALIDGGHPLFTEEDPEPIYPCPFCTQPAVSFTKKSELAAHLRQAHPGLKAPRS